MECDIRLSNWKLNYCDGAFISHTSKLNFILFRRLLKDLKGIKEKIMKVHRHDCLNRVLHLVGDGKSNAVQYFFWKISGQRSMEGWSPWGHKESDPTEQLNMHFMWVYQVWILFCTLTLTFLRRYLTQVQAYLRDTADLVLDHFDKANITIKWVTWIFQFPVQTKFMFQLYNIMQYYYV